MAGGDKSKHVDSEYQCHAVYFVRSIGESKTLEELAEESMTTPTYAPLPKESRVDIVRLDYTLTSVRVAHFLCEFCGEKATHTIRNKNEQRFVPVCGKHKNNDINIYKS